MLRSARSASIAQISRLMTQQTTVYHRCAHLVRLPVRFAFCHVLMIVFSCTALLSRADLYCRRALQADVTDAQSYYAYGAFLDRIGNKVAAEAMYREALKLNGNHVETLKSYGDLLSGECAAGMKYCGLFLSFLPLSPRRATAPPRG